MTLVSFIANIPCSAPPAWATLQRRLFAAMDAAVEPYLAKYTRSDGSLRWPDRWHDGAHQRDGVDDFYEPFVNWPLFYLLGGGDHLLHHAHRQWEAVTRQLSAWGVVVNEYERGYDQFHQSEHYTYFYTLCLADPHNPLLLERARRFAGFYLGDDPHVPNYDTTKHLIRAPHNGSMGPRWGYVDGDPSYGWNEPMRPYGLPFHDLPGLDTFDDLRDPVLALRMGEAMQERLGRGDVAANLAVVSLLANAAMLTGELRYCAWIEVYVGAWVERAAQNHGLLPDNIGLSGVVGEYFGGRWYGGLYGWTWPHGYYNLAMAALVGVAGAFLVSQGNAAYLTLARQMIDTVFAQGRIANVDDPGFGTTLKHHWEGQLTALGAQRETFVAPVRYGDQGWFDEECFSPIYPVALWALTLDPADMARIEQLRAVEAYDWRVVVPFRGKEDAGHEQPWLRFLAGENPAYPEAILQVALDQLALRQARMAADTRDLEHEPHLDNIAVHHWQAFNPISTEALVQLTLGAPQPIYNGGLLIAPLRYYDAQRQRPGLPPDVAALVERVGAGGLSVQLVNTSLEWRRSLYIQAGTFAEHQFCTAQAGDRVVAINGPDLLVELPPATTITLRITMERYCRQPSYLRPWERK
jgi:hypothetical protein